MGGWPEAVLATHVLGELEEAEGALGGVAVRLAGLCLAVAADAAQEDVVRGGAEQGERVQEAGTKQQDGEG